MEESMQAYIENQVAILFEQRNAALLRDLEQAKSQLVELRASSAGNKLNMQAAPIQAPEPVVSPPNFNLSWTRPDIFSGDGKLKLHVWLDQVSNFMKLNPIPESALLPSVRALLRGPAETWWLQYLEDVHSGTAEPVTNFEEFAAAIRMNFQGTTDVEFTRDKLDRLIQVGNIQDYNQRFNDLIREIPGMTEEEKLHRYAAGLKTRTKIEIRYRQPPNIREAQKHAVRFEEVNFRNSERQIYHRTEPMELDHLRIVKENRTQRTIICYNCNKPGHISRACPSRRPPDRVPMSGKDQPQ